MCATHWGSLFGTLAEHGTLGVECLELQVRMQRGFARARTSWSGGAAHHRAPTRTRHHIFGPHLLVDTCRETHTTLVEPH